MIARLILLWRRIRRRFSRTRIVARLLNRELPQDGDQPGLIVVQIDGLSRMQFERAIAAGRMPFLSKMLRRRHFELASFYSGLPSTTPAVQAEIMFGVPAAVPAFQFFDRKARKVVRMFDADVAGDVAKRLASGNQPLLTGGRSYSNIYAGGAAEARFCAETLDLKTLREMTQPYKLAIITVLYFTKFLRVAALALLELVVALVDVVRGVAGQENWRLELKFVLSRLAVSVVLREFNRALMKISIEEGAPIIYANFLGYDEQSHRRGPGSRFAHWVLKGIDDVIGDVFRAGHRAHTREYSLVVLSDHGQQRTEMYDRVSGRSIQEAVKQIMAKGPLAGSPVSEFDAPHSRGREADQRARRLLRIKRGRVELPQPSKEESDHNVVVTALGPLGHIYLPQRPDDKAIADYAQRLVSQAGVPLVLVRDRQDSVLAFNAKGEWTLPADAANVFGPDHPLLTDVTEDCITLCQSENAGDLVISGWAFQSPSLTFVGENGSHGSMGPEETRGFILIPPDVSLERRESSAGEPYLRGLDLYRGFWRHVHPNEPLDGEQSIPPRPQVKRSQRDAVSRTLRIMTYNIHSCIGLDGKMRPKRIAHVIRAAGADVAALQEVDVGRLRSRMVDQPREIADELGMNHLYYAVFQQSGEQYGLAVISRYPLTLVQSSHLTDADQRTRSEARGAMWVTIDAPAGPIELINTHFGLRSEERSRQITALLGDTWLGKIPSRRPVILCGDLNAGPNSAVCRACRTTLVDVCTAAGQRPRATFPSNLPIRRLDHIFTTQHFAVSEIEYPNGPLTVMASDHLPILAELSLLTKSPDEGEAAPRAASIPE